MYIESRRCNMASNIDYTALENNTYDYGSSKTFKYNGRKYYVQFPSEINEDTTIYVAGHGSGSNGITHASKMFAATKNKNVIVIEPVAVDNMKDFTNIPNLAQDIAKHYNISTPNIIMSGHSATGVNALKGGEAVIKATGSPTVVVLNDGHNTYPRVKIDSSAYKDSVVIGLKPVEGANLLQKNNGVSTMDRLKSIAKAGGKVIICTYSNTTPVHYGPTELDHNASNGVAVALGTYDLNNIKLVDSGKVKHRGNTIDAVYKYQYIDKNGVLHNFKNAEEAQKYLNEALTVITKTSYEKYENLSDYASAYSGASGTLGSNLVFVNNCMNDIKGKIQEHQDINYTKGSNNEASIVGTMYTATNYYGAVTNLLYGNLSTEADAVYKIANAIYHMDGCASQIAESTLTDAMKKMYDTTGLSSELAELNKASSDLLNTAKSSVLAGGRYDSLASIFSTKNEAGKVGKISISSLESAISSIVPSLNSEVEKATGLKASVSEFMTGIGTSNILQGGVWDNVAKNMQNYENLLDANVKAANTISDAVKIAMGIVTDYIQEASDEISAVGALPIAKITGLPSLAALSIETVARVTWRSFASAATSSSAMKAMRPSIWTTSGMRSRARRRTTLRQSVCITTASRRATWAITPTSRTRSRWRTSRTIPTTA